MQDKKTSKFCESDQHQVNLLDPEVMNSENH